MLDTLRYMDETQARGLMQDPSAPSQRARTRHTSVLLRALDEGVIPDDSVCCSGRAVRCVQAEVRHVSRWSG